MENKMCERTQEEVLARELTYIFYKGMGIKDASEHRKIVEETWQNHTKQAKELLDTLEKHEREFNS